MLNQIINEINRWKILIINQVIKEINRWKLLKVTKAILELDEVIEKYKEKG